MRKIADCGLREQKTLNRPYNPQFAIRNPQFPAGGFIF